MKIKTINIIIILLLLLGSLLCLRCPRTVPLHKCSEVYQRYVGHEGIAAAYIQDFPVNDTLTIAVTLLEATDSAGWEYLLQEFKIPEDVRLVFSQLNCKVFDWQSPRNHPEIRAVINDDKLDTGLTNNDIEICLMEFKDRRMAIFHTKNENEVYAVTNYNFYNMTNKTNVLNHE